MTYSLLTLNIRFMPGGPTTPESLAAMIDRNPEDSKNETGEVQWQPREVDAVEAIVKNRIALNAALNREPQA